MQKYKGISQAPSTQNLATPRRIGSSPDPPRPTSSPSGDPLRRSVYSSGSKEAKREEKVRRDEGKAAKTAVMREKDRTKKEKSTHKAFFSKMKSKIKSSSKKKEVKSKELQGARGNGGGHGANGVGGEEGGREAKGNLDWEEISKDEVHLLGEL